MSDTSLSHTFESLGLQPALLRAAAAAGWITPSPIQAAAIPVILQRRDVLARSPTGSGKTAAFLLPLLQNLLQVSGIADERPRRLRALVLAPTRELAVQIGAAAHVLAPQLKTVVVVGGLSINPQMLALRGGAHLLVATPGRLLDLTRQNAVHLRDLELLVLDEADRLLDAGFAEETQRVLALAPRQRQTLLFSATLAEPVKALAHRSLRDPVLLDEDAHLQTEELHAKPRTPHPDITQRALVVDSARRTLLLRHLLRNEAWPRVLVFVGTQYASEHLAGKLRQGGIAAAALHGELSQGRRGQVLSDLQTGQLEVLVATDLAARGIDLVHLPVVVNFDLPRSADDYTHRIGRTGRAGASGLAISFICADAAGSEAHFRLIEKRQGARVSRESVAGFEAELTAEPAPTDSKGGLKGKRRSKKDKLREAAALTATR